MKAFFPYLKYLKPVTRQLVLALLMGLIFGGSRGFGIPFVIKWVFPEIFSLSGAEEGLALGRLVGYCLLPAGIAVIQGVSNYFNIYFIQMCGLHLLKVLRLRTFGHLQQLPIAFFAEHPPGELISRTMQDTTALQNALTYLSMDIFRHPTTLMGALGYLVYLCWQKSDIVFLLIFLMAVPLCIFPIRMLGRRLKVKAHGMQREVAGLTQRLSENLAGYKEVRAFCLEASEMETFRALTDRFNHFQLRIIQYSSLVGPLVESVAAVGIGFALYYTYHKSIAFDEFSSLCLALYLCYAPLKELGRLHSRMQEGLASLERLERILQAPVTIADPLRPVEKKTLKGEIQFKGVSFAYEPGKPVLVEVSTTLAAGRCYALVGPSGAGKSTFAQLLPRFYEPQSGQIYLDGVDISRFGLQDLRSQISIVFQEPFLFNKTVYENIQIGNPNAPAEAVYKAAEQAYAHEFILQLPQGYASMVGSRGHSLSGGQRQRIALARAFLKHAPLLILDEATSALDSESEFFIQEALHRLIQGKTTLVIAHRLSTIQTADEILVLQEGRIIDQGPHPVLLQRCPLYQTLYRHQAF